MRHFHEAATRAATRAATLLLANSLLMAGCSSSGEAPSLSGVDNAVSEIESNATTVQPEANPIPGPEAGPIPGPEADPIPGEVSDEVVISTNDPIDETSELVAPTADSVQEETDTNELNSDTPPGAVPDPLVQNRTQVEFGITVPAYQSDALQVRLTWGDTDVTARWIGDEFWSTSLDLPTDTEHTLTVTFFDNNGDIELASFVDEYRTGSNAAEMFNIAVEQFNSEQWDTDEDGVSNLEELSLGTDPLNADNINQEDDLFVVGFSFIADGPAMYYEPEIKPLGFPANINDRQFVDDLPFTSETTVTNIDLDALGNGTYSQTYQLTRAQDITLVESSTGSRRVQNDTVSWSGIFSFSGRLDFYGTGERTFETDNTVVGSSLVQNGSGNSLLRRSVSSTEDVVDYNYSLTLDLDTKDESGTCLILHGTYFYSFEDNIIGTLSREFTMTRNSAEERWNWSHTENGMTSTGSVRAIDNRLYCDF